MEIIITATKHTLKNGKCLIIEEDKYLFCEEIWNYIKEFTGWNYTFNLHKLGIDKLKTICIYNFRFGFTNMKSARINIEKRKNLLISTIYQKLNSPTKKPKKEIYENIMTYFEKKEKKETEKINEMIKVGDEIIVSEDRHCNLYRCGIVEKISPTRSIATISLYDYRLEEDLFAIQNQTFGEHKYHWIKTSRTETIKVGSSRSIYTKEMLEKEGYKSYLRYFNIGGRRVDYGR